MENEVLMHIRELCNKRGWTIYRLAIESNIGHTTLGNLFKRNNIPTIPTLEKICDGLGITLSYFFSEDKNANPSLTDKHLMLIQRYNNLPRSDKELLEAYLSGLESKKT
jgi:transcriptional regulator with XRE-family HTH domain